jgi:hypothetical protein
VLETSDLVILKRAFPRADHEFTRGFAYLTEESIVNRIEEVDPSWTFDIMQIVHEGNNAICHARLTVKGVTRDGIGMQQIMEKAGEPVKGAATDCLKRCARLFGIGRYLLDAPKEGDGFNKWLAEQQGIQKVEVGTDVGKKLDELFPTTAQHIVVSEVEVKSGKQGKPYLVFEQDGVRVTSFTREPLRGILDETQLDAVKELGTHPLPPLKVFWKQDGEYRNVVRAELAS